MSYLWNEFNIKTIPAETLVYCNGLFREDLSTINDCNISKNYDLPVHIIYVGQIDRENTLNININVENQPVFLSVNVENKNPAFLNIFIKNTGKNSELRGHIMLKNSKDLVFKCEAEHLASNTGILLQTKIIGLKNSFSKLSATAIVNKNCENIKSDIRFAALIDKTARLKFAPRQKIQSLPDSAEHSAYMFHPNDFQINYLRNAGLSTNEIQDITTEAFMNDFNLF